MGNARWDAADWTRYRTRKIDGRSREETFARAVHGDFDPKNITMRESRDSTSNPESTAIIIAFDLTGSMGQIPHAFVREGLSRLIEEIIERSKAEPETRRMVSDPHIMIMGVGDASCDRAPLQATQFEADVRIAEQLTKIWIESGGGANSWESYNLPWYFAARRTSIDCFEKRAKKGYLFTIGDEMPPETLAGAHIEKTLGERAERDLASADVLAMASRSYEVFHLIAEQGAHCRANHDAVFAAWRALMGQRALPLANHEDLAECVVSTIEVCEGESADRSAKSWSGNTAMTVARAIAGLAPREPAHGVVRL